MFDKCIAPVRHGRVKIVVEHFQIHRVNLSSRCRALSTQPHEKLIFSPENKIKTRTWYKSTVVY